MDFRQESLKALVIWAAIGIMGYEETGKKASAWKPLSNENNFMLGRF